MATGPRESIRTAREPAPDRPRIARAAAGIRALPAGRRLAWAVFLTTQLLLLVQWAAFYPGIFSWDSLTYVWQVTTGHWVADHSVAYDALLWLSLQVTGGVAALTLLQTVAAAAALAYTATGLHRLGARARWIWAATTVAAVMPSTASFLMFVWKDVGFALSALLAFAAVAHLVAARLDGSRRRRRDLWLLALGLSGLGLFRNDGLPVVLVAVVVLIIFLPGSRRVLTAIGAGVCALTAGLTLVVYPALGVQLPHGDSVVALNLADVAVVYGEDPKSFTAADLALMTQVAPLSHWSGQAANCWFADPTMYPPMDRRAVDRLSGPLLSLWTRVLERTPQLVLKARLCRGQIAWSPVDGPSNIPGAATVVAGPEMPGGLPAGWNDNFNWSYPNASLHGNPYLPALVSHPFSATLRRELVSVYNHSKSSTFQWLFWRGASWCYLTYAVLLWTAFRRRARPVVGLIGVTLGLQLTVLAANPSQLARYMIAPIFIGLMCLPLLSVRRRNRVSVSPEGPESPEP
ncbi:hypothetical protein ABIA33_001985 [Streptacidiphilus sp. MAP12-16]|uniref:DUF6020 family protein n=1 Tax=Streptacidiphilus sp. MAP12-16 TaxID=3156300 RepID=UPI003516EB49